ncbi:MAG: hypothetical protein FJZ78_03155 [Bacteroidetes bacterium]|nr:hypothetical protein [Bacteroidota bacterium]
MATSKKIFIVIVVLFLIGLFWASYDIASRTTFPGSKGQLKERIKEQYLKPDSTSVLTSDTLRKP